jgi:hypothetical protein
MTMRSTVAVLAALVALGSLVACGSDDDTADTVAPVTTEGAVATTPPTSGTRSSSVPTGSSTPGSGVPATLPPGGSEVERAVADAARRSGIDPADVEVVSDEEVTWRDSSAGCPQKGMQYLQVITDGRRIVLAVGARQFEYHSGGKRDLFFCANPQPPLDS